MSYTNKDIYFLKVAKCVAERSKCSSRQVGAVLVKDGSIVSEGYNGAPRGSSFCQDPSQMCRRRQLGFESGEGLEQCPAVHAEMNAVAQAARNGVNTKDTTLYAYCVHPCKWCCGIIINAGIRKIVCLEGYYDELSQYLVKECGIELVQIPEKEV